MKIVINACYGGFGLSPAATKRFAELSGRDCFFYSCSLKSKNEALTEEQANSAYVWAAFDAAMPEPRPDGWWEAHEIVNDREARRDDQLLVQAVEELGDRANGEHAKLSIVEIPDGTDFCIEEYDGMEHVAEKHRVWS